MNSQEVQRVLLSILIYLVCFLVPLIPSILIYKLFPKDKTYAKGFLAGFRINASGASAAYLIILSLSYMGFNDLRSSLENNELHPWKIIVPYEVISTTPIEQISDVNYRIEPPLVGKGEKNHFVIMLPGNEAEPEKFNIFISPNDIVPFEVNMNTLISTDYSINQDEKIMTLNEARQIIPTPKVPYQFDNYQESPERSKSYPGDSN